MISIDIFKIVHVEIRSVLSRCQSEGLLPDALDIGRFTVEPPRDPAHGHLSTNLAMVLAKSAGKKPRDLAQMALEGLMAQDRLGIIDHSIDGPGFINLRLADRVWHEILANAILCGPSFGDSTAGAGQSANIEYVSANPTGPMHIGHARGAIYGDVLASLLTKVGYRVTREYYINDAGAQVDTLARSVYLRYCQAFGREIGDIPQGLYPGDYLIPVGKALALYAGERWLDRPEETWLAAIRDFAVDTMMKFIKEDLSALGVKHDLFSSERALLEKGGVERALRELERRGLIYIGIPPAPKGQSSEDWEPREQTLFRSSQFGDDVDRPLKKSDGSWTYFAADIAYHWDKATRSSPYLIDVWGADHGGYIKRIQAALTALTDGKATLDIKICQLVNLLNNGQPVKMSKRAGVFAGLREVVDQVGRDTVRFMMLTRKNDATLDFDLKKVTEQSKDNPVFYVQYAYARACSILRMAKRDCASISLDPLELAKSDLNPLTDPDELALIRSIAGWPRLIEAAVEAHEPHRVAFYLGDLAAGFHALWNKGKDNATLRFIQADDSAATTARLALVQGVRTVIASGLAVLGVEPIEEMR